MSAVTAVTADAVVLVDGRSFPGELVVGSIGVRPDIRLAEHGRTRGSGPTGASPWTRPTGPADPDIYAVGDAVEKEDSSAAAPP